MPNSVPKRQGCVRASTAPPACSVDTVCGVFWTVPSRFLERQPSIDQPQLATALHPFAIGLIAVGRRHWVHCAADRTDPRLNARRHLDRRQPGGIEDVITQHPAGVAREPSSVCFHGLVEELSDSIISGTLASPVPTAALIDAIVHCPPLLPVAFVGAFFPGWPVFLPVPGFARTVRGG